VNAHEFLQVGKVVMIGLPTTLPEACHRSACGRAYYAAFGVAHAVLVAANFSMFNNGQDHGLVVSYLKRSKFGDVVVAAGLLDQLRETRNSSDYDTGQQPVRGRSFDLTYANDAVDWGENIIQDILSAQRRDARVGIP
jgi:uncharacterized protein (UPF0332 family)